MDEQLRGGVDLLLLVGIADRKQRDREQRHEEEEKSVGKVEIGNRPTAFPAGVATGHLGFLYSRTGRRLRALRSSPGVSDEDLGPEKVAAEEGKEGRPHGSAAAGEERPDQVLEIRRRAELGAGEHLEDAEDAVDRPAQGDHWQTSLDGISQVFADQVKGDREGSGEIEEDEHERKLQNVDLPKHCERAVIGSDDERHEEGEIDEEEESGFA